VKLPQYGAGRVKEVEDDKITVVFPDGEVRKFMKEFIDSGAELEERN
jgi:hypothetical protein